MPNISDNLQSLVTAKNNIGTAITSNGGTLSTGRLEGFPNDLNNRFGEVNDTLSILLKGPTLITKNITQNGTYNAEDDSADGYSSVSVNVPNTYTASDEGKVVDNGSLVTQTDYPSEITANDTYDTTNYNSVTVNVASEANWLKTPTLGRCLTSCSKFKGVKKWTFKSWTGLTSFTGVHVWTDGENVYYSYESTQYVLDKATSTWTSKSWSGLTNFRGYYIWTDGENVYYSNNNSSFGITGNYVLDKATSTWSTKTWTGLTSFSGFYIWTDGENIYYSSGSAQWVLDKSTSTWSTKSWSGLTNFNGSSIWTDGENIYYSNGSSQYVLNKSTSTWSTKSWSGFSSFSGEHFWTDGENIYYSASSTQYVLDKSTSTGLTTSWSGMTSFNGSSIWTDGENIYYSNGSGQQILTKAITYDNTMPTAPTCVAIKST